MSEACYDPGCTEPETPETFNSARAEYWQREFIRQFVQRPGQHLLEVGRTGTGKTQYLYYMVDLFRNYAPNEALVWFDIGKTSEILTLAACWGPVQLITLEGCEIHIDSEQRYDIRQVQVSECKDVWRVIDPTRLNVASFEPFILDPLTLSKQMSRMFRELIFTAHRRGIYAPLALIYDEFHNVTPAHGYGYAGTGNEAREQIISINLIRVNIQKLRSSGIRFIATTHEWAQMFRGIRTSFEWLVPRRGAKFGKDEPRLSDFNPLWGTMKTEHCYVALPTRSYIGPIRLPYYTEGRALGDIDYDGLYEVLA